MDYQVCRISAPAGPSYFVVTKKPSHYIANLKQKYKDYLAKKNVSTSKAFYLFDTYGVDNVKIYVLEKTTEQNAEVRKNDYVLKTKDTINAGPTYVSSNEKSEENELNEWWAQQSTETKRKIKEGILSKKKTVQKDKVVPILAEVAQEPRETVQVTKPTPCKEGIKPRKGSAKKEGPPLEGILQEAEPTTVAGFNDLFAKYGISIERSCRSKKALEQKYKEVVTHVRSGGT